MIDEANIFMINLMKVFILFIVFIASTQAFSRSNRGFYLEPSIGVSKINFEANADGQGTKAIGELTGPTAGIDAGYSAGIIRANIYANYTHELEYKLKYRDTSGTETSQGDDLTARNINSGVSLGLNLGKYARVAGMFDLYNKLNLYDQDGVQVNNNNSLYDRYGVRTTIKISTFGYLKLGYFIHKQKENSNDGDKMYSITADVSLRF